MSEIFHKTFLSEVEALLVTSAAEAPGIFCEIDDYVISSGGKRVRPFMLGLCCALGDARIKPAACAGAAIEMVHTASLLHDDIVDATRLRRGQQSAHQLWGHDAVISAADHLFAGSFIMLSSTGMGDRLVPILSQAVLDLSIGEILQQKAVDKGLVDSSTYFKRIGKKTGSLFKAACEIGAVVGGLGEEDTVALSSYGFDIGLAFQILDDVLDVIGEEEKMGKRPGTDLIDRVPTLPLVEAVNASPRLLDLFRMQDKTHADVEEAIRLIIDNEGITKARSAGEKRVHEATKIIDRFGDSWAAAQLKFLAAFVLERYH